jgi:hypothetical protein
VLDDEENYLGCISIVELMQKVANTSSIKETGGIIVLEMNDTQVDSIIPEDTVPIDTAIPEDVVITDTTESSASLCTQPSYIVTCDSEYPGKECSLLSDGNASSQWLAAYSCNSRNKPCAVNNKVTISAEESFTQVTLLNRIEKDYYINRMIVTYNNMSETYILGSKYSQEEFTFDLANSTDSLQIHIVEIVGSGNRYLAGLAEVSVKNTCN